VSALRKLAGQTAIYGLSSIVARFLNFLLTPLFTSRGVFPPAEYGIITSLYAWAAFLNIVLTFGMETAYFRFSAAQPEVVPPDGAPIASPKKVYPTAFFSILSISIPFMLITALLSSPIAAGIGFPSFGTSVLMLGITLGLDALTVIPMARLRQEGKAWRFVMINLTNVAVNIGLNLFFIAYLMKGAAAGRTDFFIDNLYDPSFGVGYVFLANLVASGVKFLLLLARMPFFQGYDRMLLRPMFSFAAPLMIAGMAGMINETADRILLKYLLPPAEADYQIGIYGANYKLSILITLFIQAFRFAAEPFFFSHAREKNSRETFARIMDLFVAFCMFAFLVVMLFIDVFKYFIPNPEFWQGLRVVPILMLANVFLGIYYNQSVWYKLSDRTRYGSIIALVGAAITILLNILWVPILGYMGSAWATLVCYASMAGLSYAWGQKYWPVPYHVTRILLYMAGAVLLWWSITQLPPMGLWLNYAFRSAALIIFVVVIWKVELPALRRMARSGR
jgi:O-antigen/teichoic acid export membrane protein